MSLSGSSNLQAASTSFELAIQGGFGDRPTGVYQDFTHKVSIPDSKYYDLLVVDGAPAPREWLGSKQFGGLRAYKLSGALRAWERSIEISIDDINGDKSGAVGMRLQQLGAEAANLYDYIVVNELLSNPSCYDGTTLMSNSHANQVSGATADNLTTNALSFTEFRTGIETLRDMKDEGGEPLLVTPTTLLVGPAQERIGMEVTGSDRPIFYNASAAEATSSVIGMAMIKHYQGGYCNLVVSERITGNQWFMYDGSKGARKPMYLFEFQAPTATILDKPDDPPVFYRNSAEYSYTCKASPAAGDWRLIYGSVSA